MSLLLETICYSPRGFSNLHLHEARMQQSGDALFPGHQPYQLIARVQQAAPETNSIMKCRVLYDEEIREIQFIPYTRRIIKSFALVQADTLDYRHKYADRGAIDSLKASVQADEIIIVKNGFITDASYANLIFFDGKNWHTPAQPLLHGTRRQSLLNTGKITVADITPASLANYQSFKLINAMMDMDDGVEYGMKDIQLELQ